MSKQCSTLQELSNGYDQFATDIFRHCRYRRLEKEDAEEIVQDTFMRACKYIQKGEEIENLRVFLFQIANNLIVDWARKKKRQREKESSLEEMCDKGFDIGVDNSNRIRRRMEAQTILRTSKGLSAKDYNLLIMRYVEGLMPADIARKTGQSKNVISVRLHRALKLLTHTLKKAGEAPMSTVSLTKTTNTTLK